VYCRLYSVKSETEINLSKFKVILTFQQSHHQNVLPIP